jgi:hypothetical protein
MFTGIITAKGKISHVQPLEKGVRLTIEAPGLKLADVALGDSIAHGGVCLTVIAKKKNSYQVDVSRETLDCTVGLDAAGWRGESGKGHASQRISSAATLCPATSMASARWRCSNRSANRTNW